MATNPYYAGVSNLLNQSQGGQNQGGQVNLGGFQLTGQQSPAAQYDPGQVNITPTIPNTGYQGGVNPGSQVQAPTTQYPYGTGIATQGANMTQGQQQQGSGWGGSQYTPAGTYPQTVDFMNLQPAFGSAGHLENPPSAYTPWRVGGQSLEDAYNANYHDSLYAAWGNPLSGNQFTGYNTKPTQASGGAMAFLQDPNGPYAQGGQGAQGGGGAGGGGGGGSFTPMQGPGYANYTGGQAGGVNLPPGFNAIPTVQGGPNTFPANMSGTPGLPQALQTLLGPLAPYVSGATSGLTAAYEQALANQMIDLQSRYAGEGSYLSSPMFAAQGQLGANLGAEYLSQLGQMQLGAAEGERGRQQQTALGLAEMYSELARQAMASGATLEAARLQTMADVYRTQAGTSADMYRTNAGIYGNELQYNLGQQGLGVEQQSNLLRAMLGMFGLEQQGQGQLTDIYLRLAQAAQAGDQNALTILNQMYNQPGNNAMNIFSLLAGIPNVSSQSGPGIGSQVVGGFAQGLGQGLGGGAGAGATQGGSNILSWLSGLFQ